ncbi:MAG: response regulator [Pseudomonadota bacterium]|nr:MAG: response regulator [Pseudomonadota bacterium]
MDGFTIRKLFARKEIAPQAPRERRANKRVTPSPDDTILIVDDSRTAVHVLKTTLEQGHFRTFAATDGTTGIEVARRQQPALILMDIIMPGLNGFQATRLLRKDPLTREIPIILISGNEQVTERVYGKRLGADDFLAKPIPRGMLFTKIEHLLRREHPVDVDSVVISGGPDSAHLRMK